MECADIQVSLQLTAEQKERLLAARTYLLAQMMEIIQERTLIISMLQVWPCSVPPLYPRSRQPVQLCTLQLLCPNAPNPSPPARCMPRHDGRGAAKTKPISLQRCEAILPAVQRVRAYGFCASLRH